VRKIYLTESEVKDIVRYLLHVLVLKRREDLIETYQALPENVRRLILTYVREIETGDLDKADMAVRQEVSKMFENIYRDLKRIHERYVVIPRA